MKKKSLFYVLFVLYLLTSASAFAENFSGSCQKTSVRNLDIDLISVDVHIQVDPTLECIHWSGTVNGHKPSIVEHRETLRFKTMYRGEGTVEIILPDNIFLESCVIRLLHGNLTMENSMTAFMLLSANQSSVTLHANKIKSGMLNILNGTVKADINLKRNLSCNFNSVKGTVFFRKADGEAYGFEYVQTRSKFSFNGKQIDKANGFLAASRSKRKTLFNLMQSEIALKTAE